jgi:hypothetical protein
MARGEESGSGDMALALSRAFPKRQRRRPREVAQFAKWKSDAMLALSRSRSPMLEPHKRAALIPNDVGVSWHHFLGGRYVGPFRQADKSLAIVARTIEQQTQEHAELRGLVEMASGSSLPLVFEFIGALNLETREIVIDQPHSGMRFSGHISANGRVMVLREDGQARPLHLVHEETLAELV